MSRRNERVLVALLLLGLLGISSSYWVYRGLTVFREASRDYAAPSDDVAESRAFGTTTAGIREVTWILDGGSIQRAFYLPPRNGALVIYGHGAPGDAASLLPESLAMGRQGFGALLIDFPGYGRSQGRRNWGPEYLASIRKAVDFAIAQPEVARDRIGAFGYSMGGFVMVRAAAADDRISALVLLADGANLAEQLRAPYSGHVPGLGYFAVAAALWSGVPVAELDLRSALPRLGNRPVLIIAGKLDASISERALADLISTMKNEKSWVVEGVGHINWPQLAGDPYFARLREFWSAALVEQSAAASH